MPEIQDIIETPENAPLLLGWQWLLLALICALIICSIFVYLKVKKKVSSDANSLKKALKRLRAIQQSTNQSNLNSNELTIELSLITREYLQSQFRNKSIFQTHQEFITDHEDLDKLTEHAHKHLSTYLTALANHKYSPDHNLPEEKNKLIQHTESLLRGIHSSAPKGLA